MSLFAEHAFNIKRSYLTGWPLALLGCCFANFSLAQPNTPVYVIPVVFHVVSTNPNDLPDSYFINGLKDQNDAFAHAGVYASGIRAQYRCNILRSKNRLRHHDRR